MILLIRYWFMAIKKNLLALACAVVLGAIGVPTAGAGGANNVVLVQATTDGQVAARAHLQVAPFGGADFGSSNLAEAVAQTCFGCSTVAVAVQAVFLTGEP